MVQANVLMAAGGKSASFGVMDLMRLPLGILTRVGFIGGGVILRRGDVIVGVKAAATLWTVTVIGLCVGGGQMYLGCAATILAVITPWILRSLDTRIPREHRVTIIVSAPDLPSLSPVEVGRLIGEAGYRARFLQQEGDNAGESALTFEVRWRQLEK
jgi:putative Mg2+ transporter-C (MgtC) family protein